MHTKLLTMSLSHRPLQQVIAIMHAKTLTMSLSHRPQQGITGLHPRLNPNDKSMLDIPLQTWPTSPAQPRWHTKKSCKRELASCLKLCQHPKRHCVTAMLHRAITIIMEPIHKKHKMPWTNTKAACNFFTSLASHWQYLHHRCSPTQPVYDCH